MFLNCNSERIPRSLLQGASNITRLKTAIPDIGQRKKREALNPEPGTRNLITQAGLVSNLCAIPWSLTACGYLYKLNNEACLLCGDLGY